MEEIADLSINEERIIDIEERIDILGNRVVISDCARSLTLKEIQERKKSLTVLAKRRNVINILEQNRKTVVANRL